MSWETASPSLRVSTVPFLQNAVQRFFTLNLVEAGREMDRAWLELNADKKSDSLIDALIGERLLVSPVCADTKTDSLELELTTFYATENEPPPQTSVDLKLTEKSGQLQAETQVSIDELVRGTSWKLNGLPEGDYDLTLTFVQSDNTFTLPPITISRIRDLRRRLGELEASAATLKIDAQAPSASTFDQTLAATLRDEVRFFRNLLDGLSQEADFPYSQRLKNCELLFSSRSNPKNISGKQFHAKEFWISLADGTRSVPTRIRLPSNMKTPVPVLLVFHGAGGSENMFFETYGAGRVISESAERGWIVVSPRQGLFGLTLDISKMLNALESFASIDRNRIMLLGHSMGAAQVVQQVCDHPSLPVAAIALGGGGRLSLIDGQQSQKVAWYVGAGSRDFGLASAQQLNRSLVESNSNVRFKTYRDVEHLVVVQAAIDDAFTFLDEVLTKHSTSFEKP
ncbi:dienelactone hydrolase family protein [bacterium]|nr:dienelactone hydrolase family protein [bacterium]